MEAEYDIHNQGRKIKGRFTHSFQHPCGAGFRMKHEAGMVHHVTEVIKSMNVRLIIELGTFNGGFTKLLEDAMPDTEIHTFDSVNTTRGVRKHFGENVTFHICNVLNYDCGELNKLLYRQDRKLLYCDNGRKKQEVEIYHSKLYHRDFIGVHDWGNEIFWKDVEPFLGYWSRYKWSVLEELGLTSRFWENV